MRASAVVIALVLFVLAISFLLVRMDVLHAEWLRFLPAAMAIVVAGGIIVMALRRKRAVQKQGKKQ
jgi:hypothetical protein